MSDAQKDQDPPKADAEEAQAQEKDAPKAADGVVEGADANAGAVEGEDEEYHSRIIIKPDGEVVIENLSIDLMELLEMLDPDAEAACEIPEGHAAAPEGQGEVKDP